MKQGRSEQGSREGYQHEEGGAAAVDAVSQPSPSRLVKKGADVTIVWYGTFKKQSGRSDGGPQAPRQEKANKIKGKKVPGSHGGQGAVQDAVNLFSYRCTTFSIGRTPNQTGS